MSYETKNIRNVCLLGHGGSGKTTLAESMLYMTGAIDRQGKTADGNTVCDYDPEEIKRQITISTSIAPVNFGGCKINVLDCPGFFDFAGDVMCALRAVEAGMIFCTAKDGIAVGAERSWKYLKNANMPCMFYISKTDEDHGDFAGVLSALQEKYGSAVCAVTAPMSDGTGVIDLVHNVAYQTKGNKTTKVAVPAADADMVESLRETLGVMIVDARHKPTADDETMAAWFHSTGCPMVVVANKCDKLKKSEIEPNLARIRATLLLPDNAVLLPFSAEKGTGREALLGEIFHAVG